MSGTPTAPTTPSTTPGHGTRAHPHDSGPPCHTRTAESTTKATDEPRPDLTPQPDERSRLAAHVDYHAGNL